MSIRGQRLPSGAKPKAAGRRKPEATGRRKLEAAVGRKRETSVERKPKTPERAKRAKPALGGKNPGAGPFRFAGRRWIATEKDVPGRFSEWQRGRLLAHRSVWGHEGGVPGAIISFVNAAGSGGRGGRGKRPFNESEKVLESRIRSAEEFVRRAHSEGISTFEAVAMQNHIRRQFSPKQRSNFRRQIASLYRTGRITIKEKERMERLLDRASHVADEHFMRLSEIVPEGQELHKIKGAPDIFEQPYGDGRAKKVLRFLGFFKKEAA